MKRIALLVLLTALAAPSAFACRDCPDGLECTFTESGFGSCFETPDGCRVSGSCLMPALSAQYRVAAVRVIESGKPLPAAKPAPAPVLSAAK